MKSLIWVRRWSGKYRPKGVKSNSIIQTQPTENNEATCLSLKNLPPSDHANTQKASCLYHDEKPQNAVIKPYKEKERKILKIIVIKDGEMVRCVTDSEVLVALLTDIGCNTEEQTIQDVKEIPSHVDFSYNKDIETKNPYR